VTSTIALALAGCGGSTATDPLASAADATAHVGGAHMTITANVTSATLPAFTMKGAGVFNYSTDEGTFTLHMSGLPAGALSSGPLQMSEIYKRDSVYLNTPLLDGKLPGGKQWMKLDLGRFSQQLLGADISQLTSGGSNPAQVLHYLKAVGGGVTAVGHETVRGVTTTHYHGVIEFNKLVDLVPAAVRSQARAGIAKLVAQTGSSSLPVDVWVDGRNLVRRIRMLMSLAPAGTAQQLKMDMTLDLFDFGPVPAVASPPDGDVYDATATALGALGGS
jgi:hypothetical protein